MWGEVTPAERLRAVTRRHVDEDRLAAEAADALAGFAHEPASLVVACRRVLAHHRTFAPLWWVCARILAAADPGLGAHEAVRMLESDRTADRLGATLPLLEEDQVVAVVGWPEAVDLALQERLDIAAVALRLEGADPAPALRRRVSDRSSFFDCSDFSMLAPKPNPRWPTRRRTSSSTPLKAPVQTNRMSVVST